MVHTIIEHTSRAHERSSVLWAAKLATIRTALDNPPSDCIVFDVSAGGAQLRIEDDVEPGDLVSLTLRFGTFPAKVAWTTDARMGIIFQHEPKDVLTRIPAMAAMLTSVETPVQQMH